mgnify:CR=1 FL=1
MEIKVEIKNLGKMLDAFKQSPQIVGKYLNKSIREGISEIRREAVPRTPVANPSSWKHPVKGYVGGRLRGSYEQTIAPFRGELYPTVNYAIFVHEGTRFMKGRPFLKQGIEAAQGNIERRFEHNLEKALQEIASKV